ncbi:MAG: RNA polymerase sigma-70 factor [Spirosomataceae bacterium]
MQLTDSEVIEAIRQGNERVFEQVFRKYYASLCQYANSILKDSEDAEEVVQNLFCTWWEKRVFVDINVSIKAYLYRSVHNHCLNRVKHLKIQDTYRQHNADVLEQTQVSATDQLQYNELQQQLQQAIDRLPEQCRLVFRLSRFEELKYAEIAEQLGISVKTVENQIGKALKILRTQLADFLTIGLVLALSWMLSFNQTIQPRFNHKVVDVTNGYVGK